MTDYVQGGSSERLVRGRQRSSSALWGMAMLVASEATLFGAFFGTYYYLRFKSPHWPPLGTPEPRVVVPLILVAVLATTSVPMQLAAAAARAGRLAATRAFLGLALVVQCGYFAYEIHDLVDQLRVSQPQDNAYSSIYYLLLGADHAHVFVGLVLSLWLLGKLTTGLTTYRRNATQAIAFYWHAVNLLTLFVIGTLLSATV